ncbi:MAG: hypothetical protein ACI8VE_001945 [Natrialbaceae archaeon]
MNVFEQVSSDSSPPYSLTFGSLLEGGGFSYSPLMAAVSAG